MDPVYTLESPTRAVATEFSAGPWDPRLQHGGAPSALICWAVEKLPTAVPMRIARLTVDLLRPVPIGPIDIETEVVREGRKIQVCSARLLANGVEVVRASLQKVRIEPVDPPPETLQPMDLPSPDAGQAPPADLFDLAPRPGFTKGMSLREVKGAWREPGPAAIWFRRDGAFIEGEETTPAMKAAQVADFPNGVSNWLDFSQWSFINGDMTMNLARMPVGDWICLDADSYLGDAGAGVAFGRLGDEQGWFGRTVQSMVIERR